MPRARFLSLGTIECLSQIIIYWGNYSVHCRMFSSSPGLYPLDSSSWTCTHHFRTTQNVSSHCQMCPGGSKPSPWEPLLQTEKRSIAWSLALLRSGEKMKTAAKGTEEAWPLRQEGSQERTLMLHLLLEWILVVMLVKENLQTSPSWCRYSKVYGM